MYKVRKRDGKIISFDLNKISEAIKRAFEAEEVNYTDDIIDFLTLKVTAEFNPKIVDNIVNVEDTRCSRKCIIKIRIYRSCKSIYFI